MTDMYDICWDFDGVIHPYSRGWQNGEIYDEPTQKTLANLEYLRRHRVKQIVCSARDASKIREWLDKHGLEWIPVTNEKPIALIYPDDRGFRWDGDESWSDFLFQLPTLLRKTLAKEAPPHG